MKRSQVLDYISRHLYALHNGEKDMSSEAEEILSNIEKIGMKPPCVSGENVQALLNIYVNPMLYQWDEDLEKDKLVQEFKAKRLKKND